MLLGEGGALEAMAWPNPPVAGDDIHLPLTDQGAARCLLNSCRASAKAVEKPALSEKIRFRAVDIFCALRLAVKASSAEADSSASSSQMGNISLHGSGRSSVPFALPCGFAVQV